MSHFALLWKARTIEKHRQNYENEKHNSIIMSNADVPNKTLLQRWKHYSHDVQKRLSRTFSKWYPEGTTMSNFLVNIRAEMMFPHILLRSLFGFVGGLVLTYLCFVFLVFQLFLPLIHATVLSSLFGVLITLGLTFSNRMRCLVFLLIPQLFSRAGRYTLTCYALVLILTGPATNTLKNSEVLSESMACNQEKIKVSARDINQLLTKPFNSIQDSIKLMVEQLKRITLLLRTAILRINRLILSIASLIQSNFSWLGTIAESCNNQLGSPYQRCVASLKKSVEDCKGCSKDARWYYSAVSLATIACGVLTPYEKFCVPSDFVGETFYATIRRKLKLFTNRISEAISLKIRTRHSYTFIGNTSSPSQVAAGIVTEIRNRADPILTWLSWSSCVTSLFLLLIIFRAKYYQHMYETRSRFDNRYITKEFRELDLRRLREGRETVLPLNRRERAKYVTTTSFRLVASEKIYLNRSAVFMTITSFKLLIHIVADYSLYWVLMTIRYHGQLQSPVQPGLPTTGAHITGTGFLSRLLQALFNTMNIPLLSAPSSTSCLPKPHPPDFKRYSQIGTLIVLLWVFSLFEPYGLRLRHLIMGHYKPERAKTRAAWLYNHILRTRGSFMKFARRKLHREYKYRSENKLTFRHWLRSLIPFKWLQCLLGVQLQEAHCLLCNTVQDDQDVNTKLTRCQDPNCPGTFCNSCFSDIGQMCTICLSPKDYGDLSDVSLEKGSSDEDDDNDDENGGSTPNNESDVKERTDSDENSNDNGNIDTKYESDNQSEYSENRRDIFYEIAPLIHHHKEVTNVNKYNMMGILDKQTFTTTKKYFAPSYEYKQNSHIFYNFYKINIRDTSLHVSKHGHTSRLANCLRKKVYHSKKCTNISKINKYILTCKNNKKEGTKKAKKEDKKNKDPGEKKGKNTKKNCDKKLNNIRKDEETKKPKKHQKDDNTLKATNKSPCIYSFQAKCSKYWKNISFALSCTDIGCTKKCLPIMKEKKHNCKKKSKKGKDNSSKHHKKENNEDARKYRISTYLADQDWKKKETIADKTGDASSLVQTTKNFEENEIEVNHIRIPRLNLRFSSESLNNNYEGDKIRMRNYQPKRENYNKRKYFKFDALDRIVKRISFSSITINSEDDSKGLKMEDKPRHLNMCNSEVNMPRSMKYFRSLGHDFVQRHTHELLAARSARNDVDYSCPKKASSKISNTGSENSHIIKETIFNEHIKSVEKIEPTDDISKTKIQEPINLKNSTDDPTKNSSNPKRQSSERMFGFGLKTPLVKVIKDFCNSLFSASEEKKLNTRIENLDLRADKEIVAIPCTQSCGCQKSPTIKEQKDHCVQVEQKLKSDKKKSSRFFKHVVSHKDVHVNAVNSTCTCATQHYTSSRDVGTLKIQTGYRFKISSDSELFEDSEDSDSDTESTSTMTDATHTNTTVCSLATLDYRKGERREERGDNRRKRVKVKVITKANRSTLTERANVCDVSTVTHDWWSPIVEKKECKKELAVEQKKAELLVVKERRRVRNRGMVTDGRIVTFMSKAQIIPTNSELITEDILSPSRYLLESQKYYNELYASKLYSPHVFPVARLYQYQKFEPRSPMSMSSHHQTRRGRRTKRLEDCYTRKQQTPIKKRLEYSKPPDWTRQVRQKRIT